MHSRSLLSATKDFISSIFSSNVAIETFVIWRLKNYYFQYLSFRLPAASPERSKSVFKMKSSRFSNPSVPITTDLTSSFKISMQSFLRELDWLVKSRHFFSVEWNLDGTEMPEHALSLDTHRCSNLYFFNSTYLILFHQGVNLDSIILEADCPFPNISK